MPITIADIKKLREATDAGVSDCREALEESEGDFEKAREWLRQKGIKRAEKKMEREVKAGAVFPYIHHNQTLGSLVSVACETDFVAKTDVFQKLGKELAMQAATTGTISVEKFMKTPYVRDPGKTIEDLVKENIGTLGENIQVVDVLGTSIKK